MSRTRRGEAGVTIVEAAFVIPLLFMFIFGLVDLGMWTLNSNQASNAARDGARVGILEFPLRATETYEDAKDDIVSAIQGNLPEGTISGDDVEVVCLDDLGWSTDACSGSDPERVRVRVEWAWTLVTPVATILGIHEGEVGGSATMEIVGRPVPGGSGVDPGTDDPLNPDPVVPCVVSGLTAPAEVYTKGNQLRDPMLITFDYVSGDCSDLQVELTGTKATGADKITHFCGCGDATDVDGIPIPHVWEYSGSDNIWQSNGNRGVVTLFNGDDRLLHLARVEFKVS